MNKQLLLKMVEEQLIVVNRHNTADLFIYNYSKTVQFERLWNEVTLMSRGLILDKDMNIVARPFLKFFNLFEPEVQIPNEPFEVFDKLDGSMGILYWNGELPYIATRGSFHSEQAEHASVVLHQKYSHAFGLLDKTKTYLFEIIYPENRIVLNYGDTDDIILLGIVDNETGKDVEIPKEISDVFQVVTKFDGIKDFRKLTAVHQDNKEGFVIRFLGGLRVKMKFDEYCRLHYIITEVSNRIIWEHMRDRKPLDEILEQVPDEFYDWVKMVQQELWDAHDAILNECKAVYKEFPTQKELAEYNYTQKYPAILFQIAKGYTFFPMIWKMIKPKYARPFQIAD